MSGQVIARPARAHECSPGWTYSEASGGPPFHLTPGTRIAHPPSAYDYPEGTVWQCECGRTWVSRGEVPGAGRAGPGMMEWRPERRLERRRRERRSKP